MKKNQNGNALFFILIAIFLLGALTVLLNRGSQQTEETGASERVSVEVSKLIRYTSSIATAVQRMRSQGVSESDISFANDIYVDCVGTPVQDVGHNANCTKPECEIFDVRGGGLKPLPVPDSLYDPIACGSYPRGMMTTNVKIVEDIGTTASDLVLEIFEVSREACIIINKISGIENPGGEPPEDAEGVYCIFNGDYGCATSTLGDDAPEVAGKKNFCTKRPAAGYHVTTVLLAR